MVSLRTAEDSTPVALPDDQPVLSRLGVTGSLRREQELALQRGATAEVSKLQVQIGDVEEFRTRLEKIERGDELNYRVRCRWKGRSRRAPGLYQPDIDDGVKVNIRPFQEAGLLAVREVIKKW